MNAAGIKALQRRVAEAAADLGRTYTVALVLPATPRRPYPTVRGRGRKGTQPTNGTVLTHLQATGRDVTEVTVQARARIVGDVLATLPRRDGLPNASQLWLAVGAKWRALVLERLAHEGADLGSAAAPANSPEWTALKVQLGLDSSRLRASGQLLDAVSHSTVEIRGR